MLWDPLESWPNERRWIWSTIALWLVVLRGPAFLENLRARPPSEIVPDFFQEYASARGWIEGRPLYADHRETIPRYLGGRLDEQRSTVVVNAHPPASVLLALPSPGSSSPLPSSPGTSFPSPRWRQAFGLCRSSSRFPSAVSLWLRSWRCSCFAIRFEHCRLGQLTLILLLLVTGAWAAERSGRPLLAGLLFGTATAVKLFPGFLLIYSALRGRWRVVTAGLVTIGGLLALTTATLGFEAHRTYFATVLPSIQWFRVGWDNNSLWGFWSRLFDPAPEHVRDRSLTEPLIYSPTLAVALSLVSSAAATAVLAWAVRRDASGRKSNLTFALAVVAMLLVSPICWLITSCCFWSR